MNEDISQEQLQHGHHSGEMPHTTMRKMNTLPVLISASLLEAVIEEDENSANKEQSDITEGNRGLGTINILNSELASRAKSTTSETAKQENVGFIDPSSDSESDVEDIHHHDSHSENNLGIEFVNEKEWDTDLETEEPQVSYDHTGKTAYVEACRLFDVVPAAYFLRHMNDNNLSMKHHGLTKDEMKAIAASLASNTTINMLDLSDNWLQHDGGLAICEALRDNCFITDLNLSDNHLSLCAEQLCTIIKQNSTLCRVNLSGNNFDDQCAAPLADLILNTTKLECLSLSHNSLGEEAGILLGLSISENLCLKELDLSWNHLRRKGAMAVANGIKNNVYMKRINLSWNGFGLEGSLALMDALRTNSVLEEMDVTNNRITTEGAVLIGKGLTANETLTVFKIGKNPIQSAGCWGIAAAVLRNPNCNLKNLDFTDIPVNNDFVDIWKQVEEKLPNIKLIHGGIEGPMKITDAIHPREKIIAYMNRHTIRLVDFFSRFDKDDSMTVTKEDFKQGIELLNKTTSIGLTDKDVNVLLEELDMSGSGEIKYRELELGNLKVLHNEQKSYKTLRPRTS